MKSLIIACSLLVLSSLACTNIEPGHVGILINKCSDGVQSKVIGTGYHWVGPFCERVVEYPTYVQTMVLTKNPHEGHPQDESLTIGTSQSMGINLDASMSFTLKADKVPGIYTKFKQDLDTIQNIYLRQTVRDGIQKVFSKYTAEQLSGDKREIARAEVQEILTKELAPDGFLVTQFTINELRVPQQVTAAINAKVAMIQEAQRADAEVKRTQALAAQAIAKAEGEAQAKKLNADAEAYANKTVAASITPVLVEYIKTQKWDGKLPTVSGGITPMISLK